ncbi:MAG: U32 family peptidase [Proteobacteria bacterium]|nr:U32 family peptidase [Pseudomonadota bacterium]MBU4068673.1 U32 family peptidase [Pseudomonadota bacterium]MBU4100390.1 U32 family peptidase [Pseudomonadota bacterium]MBU4126942.1 U32 family peptidase [Pseudomonadota bacterium]
MSEKDKKPVPDILAPAGNKNSFLAALAAGADAIYCGLNILSARMEAKNFSIEELVSLVQLAHDMGTKVYVAFNSLLKQEDLNVAGRLIDQLERFAKPDALIIQDLSLIELIRQTGFTGEIHLSTLANISFPMALKLVQKQPGVNLVVVPRELSIDEIKAMAKACPSGLGLEVFVHGALCYGISGRCYWSSYMGGKSGLRGRCVQPCRRFYTQGNSIKRFFSCQDLSLDALVKVLLSIPEVKVWKIEGRKKGPHYVYYLIKAYQILRDHGSDPQMKKTALQLISRALGRESTHFNFLPQRPYNPINTNGQTASGLYMGKIKGPKGKPYFIPIEELLPGDVLRIGYEDDHWHSVSRVGKYVPERGRLYLKLTSGKNVSLGSPVFLIDRREKALGDMMAEVENKLSKPQEVRVDSSTFHAKLSKRYDKKQRVFETYVFREMNTKKPHDQTGIWLYDEFQEKLHRDFVSGAWWWLPPVIWPEHEEKYKKTIEFILKKGGRNFVLNIPWQMAFFKEQKKLNLWAGPFCNITNTLAIDSLANWGFTGVIVSPELGQKDYLQLPEHSPLPLGIVISGNWPLSISRFLAEDVKTEHLFSSPKGEHAWVKKYGSEFWVYPNWELDLRDKKEMLKKAGYSLFVNIIEPLPKEVKMKKRPGLWNWDLDLL